MSRSELRKILMEEAERWSKKPYQELVALTYPVRSETGIPGQLGYHETQIDLLESNEDYIHVGIAANDNGWSSFVPVSTSIMAYAPVKAREPTA